MNMKRDLKKQARDQIIQACINAVLVISERGETELSEAIRFETVKLAKRLTPETTWHGLPETFE